MIRVKTVDDYLKWLDSLNIKEQAQVRSRIERIETLEHFGNVKNLGNDLAELRWKNG